MPSRLLSLLTALCSTILIVGPLIPSEARAQTTDTEFWSSATVDLTLAKRFRGALTQGLRLDQNVSGFKNTYTQLEFDFRLKTLLGFAGGYRYIIRSTSQQHRAYFDLFLRHTIKSAKLKLQLRSRIQQTIRPGNNNRTHFRNRAKVSRRFKWGDPYASFEASYRVDKGEFRGYRITGGIKWRPAKRWSVSTYYARSQDVNRLINNVDNILGLSLVHRFK